VLRLLVTANVFSSSPILVILMLQVIRSSETSVLQSHRRKNLKSYIALRGELHGLNNRYRSANFSANFCG
jgi:hypothetical protein